MKKVLVSVMALVLAWVMALALVSEPVSATALVPVRSLTQLLLLLTFPLVCTCIVSAFLAKIFIPGWKS